MPEGAECVTDADCQAAGDHNLVCSNATLNNSACVCRDGFHFFAPASLCIDGESRDGFHFFAPASLCIDGEL